MFQIPMNKTLFVKDCWLIDVATFTDERGGLCGEGFMVIMNGEYDMGKYIYDFEEWSKLKNYMNNFA